MLRRWRQLRPLLQAVAALVTCAVLVEVVAYAVTGTAPVSRTQQFLISEGYSGWIVVDYSRPECAPAKKEGFSDIFEVPPGGAVCTSTPQPTGWYSTLVYATTQDGTRQKLQFADEIQPGTVWMVAGAIGEDRTILFIGTQEQFNAAQADPDHPR